MPYLGCATARCCATKLTGTGIYTGVRNCSLPCRAGGYWFWVPIVAPHIGAFLGAFTYLTMITANLPSEAEKQSKKSSNNDVTAEAEELKTIPFTSS
jgi:hypothetical protein